MTQTLAPRPNAGIRGGQRRNWMAPAVKTFTLGNSTMAHEFKVEGQTVTVTRRSFGQFSPGIYYVGPHAKSMDLAAGRVEYRRLLNAGYRAIPNQ
jgi:hypothetical protein